MADIKPFRAIRPSEGMASKVAALPYDVYNRQEAKEAVEGKPYSFLRIDRAETSFDDSVDTYSPQVYEQAKQLLTKFKKDGVFEQDLKPCYYIYELTMGDRIQTGIVACASIDDYLTNVIKKHELTREDKELDRIQHVEACETQTGPIFLAYRSNFVINDIIEKVKEQSPIFDFVSEDGIGHRGYVIQKKQQIDQITYEFEQIHNVYIADGHHRAASAVKAGLRKREENAKYTGKEEFNYFLSVLFPDYQLKILPYNRVVQDLNGFSSEEFMKQVKQYFEVTEQGKNPYEPQRKGMFGMYLDEQWYSLRIKESYRYHADPVEELDVSILQQYLLTPILGIEDPRTSKRIDFIGGIRGLKELERRVKEDMRVAFAMYPTSIEELFAVADADKLMPPKSTWFEPKLRSGLFLHSIV